MLIPYSSHQSLILTGYLSHDDLFFYLFLLAFYFTVLFLYTTDFNPRINKDIIGCKCGTQAVTLVYININSSVFNVFGNLDTVLVDHSLVWLCKT